MNPRRRFATAYAIVIAFFLSLAASATIATLTIHARTVSVGTGPCPIITEKTPPDVVDRCIAGKLAAKGRFPQSVLGLPQDGYCEDHSNEISWRLIKCMGTQPESQP